MNKLNKNTYFKIIWIFLVFFVFIVLVIQQYIDDTTKRIIGKHVWCYIYIILPIIIALIPFIIKHFLGRNKEKKTIIYSCIILAIYISTVIIIPISSYKYIKVFTPDKWLQYRYDRILMFEDLNSKYDLKGMTKDQVRSILGIPDVETENEMEYIVAKGWIDPEMMLLKFDNQRVTEGYTYIEFKSNKIKILIEN